MTPSPFPWQLALARLDGALPFLSAPLAEVLALASLRRLWSVHVRDFWFEDSGLEHNPGLEASELMRSWYAAERRDFLSWIARRAPPPLARAACLALAAKGLSERYTGAYDPAERALGRLDALLPTREPLTVLEELVEQLRRDEVEFLEGASELYEVGGRTYTRPAPRGAAWAASLAVAMRPHLFGLGTAPFALAGLAPRAVFRAEPEDPIPAILGAAIAAAVDRVRSDLDGARRALAAADERLAGLYASSRAPDAFALLLGLGPLTRAELARAVRVTKRTASQAAVALEQQGLATLRAGDAALLVKGDGRSLE